MLNHGALYCLSGSIKFAFLRPKGECVGFSEVLSTRYCVRSLVSESSETEQW